jgi:aryl-alcohol dehydrogenase-like predicted oxidoreductase
MELTDHDLKAGGNVIDTAESRVHWLPGGEHQSEKVIGEWLRERGTRRQIILSTKATDRRLESMEVPRPSKTEIRDRFQRVRRLCAAMERHQIKSLERPIEVGPPGPDSWVIG